MKYVISRITLTIILVLSPMSSWANEALSEILRTAALNNGIRPAAQLFIETDSNLASIGKKFFESENVSLNGKISCRTCHLDEFGSADGLPNAIGIFGDGKGPNRAFSDGKIVPRNTLPLWGRGAKGFQTFFWDGKVDFSEGKKTSQFGDDVPSDDALITAVHVPPLEIREMLNDDDAIARFKREIPEVALGLRSEIVKRLRETEGEALKELAIALGVSLEEISFLDVSRSIASFIRSEFQIRNYKFNEFIFGTAALTPDELKGGIIFYGKGKCTNCHNGPYYSDLGFHAIPFPQIGFGKNGFGVDYGRFNVTFKGSDLYKFRTPPLLNVDKTAPYGHAGSIFKLEDAITAHFDPLSNIDPKSMSVLERHEFFKRMAASKDSFNYLSFLSEDEIRKVASFLKTLSF